MAIDTASLRLIQPRGWTAGLPNFLRKELHAWWGTRFWLIQTAVWLAVVNGILVIVLWVAPATDPNMKLPEGGLMAMGLQVFFAFAAQAAAMGAAILGMGAIIAEKQSGTAAWVLSKPLSRTAFITAKLVALSLGVLLIAILLQGVVAFGQIAAVTRELPGFVPFAIGLGVLAVHTLFYLTLVVMLGTFLNSRGAVVGIALGLLFGQQLAGNLLGPVAMYLPNSLGALATLASMGEPLPSVVPVVVTALLSVVFVAAALWRFGREEL
jgi:ABC-2 type transport system permease protein